MTLCRAVLASTVLLVSAAGCSRPATRPAGRAADKAKANHFTSKADGFSITAPATWERVKKGGVVTAFFMEPLTSPSDLLNEDVAIAAEKVPSDVTLDVYYKAYIAHTAEAVEDLKVLAKKKATLDKLSALCIVLEHTVRGHVLKVLDYIVIRNGYAYSVSFTSTDDDYAKYEKVFEQIAKTFHTFKPAPKPADANEFTSKAEGFSITAPPAWDRGTSKPPAVVRFVEPLTSASDAFHENLGVSVQHMLVDVDLDTCVRWYEIGMKSAVKGLKVVSATKTTLAGDPAKRIVLKQFGGRKIEFLFYAVIANHRAYGIVFTTTTDQAAEHEAVFENICKTFKTFKPADAETK